MIKHSYMVEYTVARTNCPSNSDRKTNRHRDMVTNKQVDTQANRRTDIKKPKTQTNRHK